jgi:sigma-B regulation protein RsbU (phosphoserine phosphatase)
MTIPDDIQIPLFASIPADEIRKIFADLRHIMLPPDATLFHEGDRGDSFYIVLEGMMDIIQALGTGDERLLITMTPGDYFGEMCLLDPLTLRSASVVSRTEVRLLEMSRTDFGALLRRWPEAAYDLARSLSSRLRRTDNTTILELKEKNRLLEKAYRELQAAQAEIIEKEKLDRELHLAWEIQNSMLPHSLPGFRGFDFGTRIVPARVVGGDFYDFIPLDDNTLGIAVGDVSGKGVPAALFMAMTRSLMRSEARGAGSAREALLGVNRNLLEMNDTEMFVTVLYGVLNRQTCEFHYGRAGHELPILCNNQGSTIAPGRGLGQPLGIAADPAIDEQSIVLSPGDTLLLFTDGVTDAFDDKGRSFGLERLRASLGTCCNDPPQQVCDRLTDLVMEYQYPTPQFDDVTVVAIRAS